MCSLIFVYFYLHFHWKSIRTLLLKLFYSNLWYKCFQLKQSWQVLVISYCLDFNSLKKTDIMHTSIYYFTICIYSFVKCPLNCIAQYLIRLFNLLLLSFRLYIDMSKYMYMYLNIQMWNWGAKTKFTKLNK